jgi:hypothetical protein
MVVGCARLGPARHPDRRAEGVVVDDQAVGRGLAQRVHHGRALGTVKAGLQSARVHVAFVPGRDGATDGAGELRATVVAGRFEHHGGVSLSSMV